MIYKLFKWLDIESSRLYRILRDSWYNTKWYIQKKVRGYSDPDMWDVGMSILQHAHFLLSKFKESNRMGRPTTFATNEEWEDAIQRMIDGMDFILNGEDRMLDVYMNKAGGVSFDDMCKCIDNIDWKAFRSEYNREYVKAQEGLQLFIDNIQALWD